MYTLYALVCVYVHVHTYMYMHMNATCMCSGYKSTDIPVIPAGNNTNMFIHSCKKDSKPLIFRDAPNTYYIYILKA